MRSRCASAFAALRVVGCRWAADAQAYGALVQALPQAQIRAGADSASERVLPG